MAATGDNVEEEDWFSNVSIKKLMIKTKNYEQQEAESSSKKSGQADTYLYHCHKLLRAPNCGINDSRSNNHSNSNNKNNNIDNREASSSIKRLQKSSQKQDQVQFRMRLLVINNNVDATQEGLEEATCRSSAKKEASQSTSSNLSHECAITSEPVMCKLNQRDHNESNTSMQSCRKRFQVLAEKCQLLYGESNMILSDAKVNRKLFGGELEGGKSQRDYDKFDATINNEEYLKSVSRREKQSSQRKRRFRRRGRPEVRSIKLISARSNFGPIKMWPSWRKLVLLSLLSILLTTFLANLNIISPMSSSSCLLFNHCHALSMQQQASSSNFFEAAPGTKITHPNLSSPTSTIQSTSTSAPTESPPFMTSSTQKNTNSFLPTLKPRYSQLTPTTPNASGASINAPTVSPLSTTQSSNVAVAFVPASSQRLSLLSTSTLSSVSSATSAQDKDKKHSVSTPTSLWSSKLKPTEQQLHKQQQQQHRYLHHAKQQQLTQLTGVAKPNKTTTSEIQQAYAQEFTTPASLEGGNNRQKFNLDNNYQNANKNSKSSDINNNGNFQAGAKISIKNNGQGNSRASVGSSITRESHVEPQMISSSGKSDLLRVGNSDELPAIVVAMRAQQQQHSKVPTQSSSAAIKLIASPTLHVSESSTTSSSTQINPSSPSSSSSSSSPFTLSASQATIQQVAKPTSSKSLQLGDGWSITSDSITTPNSLMNDTSIRYNPGIPPADLYKAADSTGRASILTSSGGSSLATSPPATSKQTDVAQLHQQPFLVPTGGLSMPQNLFQSMINSALSDLINNEQLFGAATTNSRPIVMRSRIHPVLYQPNLNQPLTVNNRRFQLNSNNNNNNNQPSKQSMAASASAPSISLPPLSHFLVPRNPFRLFSSSSSTNPITTRYRPSFMVNKLTGKANNKQAKGNANGNEQQTNRWSNIGPHYASATNSFPRTPSAFQGSSTLTGLDDNTNTNLYAHSHSAEQLERLVRAASQATGVNSPILPAIVSAPSGAFPGYYIPAIESPESESQVSELRHGEPSSSISSKIPGTDYILHPDEVRAMINIGEIAWRQQQQNEQAASSKSNSISFNQQQQQQQDRHQGQDSSVSETRDWQFGNRNLNSNQGFTGYMQENHAENARDFAYVDPSNRRDQMQAHSSNNNDDHHQQNHLHQHQTRQAPVNSSELESHLMKHFNQKQLSSFPAIIRVNDQDYVHWPLIKMGQNEQSQANKHRNYPLNNFEESRKFSAILHPFQINVSPFQRPNQFFALASQLNNHYRQPALLQQMPLAMGGLQHHFQHQNMPTLVNGWAPSASMINPSVVANQKSPLTLHIDSLDQSPVRLATQLTPQEVRQVEDSIIEALIMNQSLKHQRKIKESLVASQNQFKPTLVIPNHPIDNLALNEINQKQNSGMASGFFGRRRRRNSSNNKNTNQSISQKEISHEKIRQLLLAATASSSHLLGPIPLLNVSALPIHIISPMLPYADLPGHAIVGPAIVQPEESLVLESRLAPKHRIPVLIADQETNKPNLLKPASSQEIFSADSSAPKATILKPASDRPQLDISFGESKRASMHSGATFGSRVSRINQNPSVRFTSGTSTYLEEPFVEPERTKLSIPSVNMIVKSQTTSDFTSSGRKLVRENEPYSDRTRSEQIISFSSDQSTSRPYRHVDWPTMVSDADYFPDGNGKASNNPMNSNVIDPQQVQQAESRGVNQKDKQQSLSNNQGDNDNLYLSSSHVIRPSQSNKKYVTSQLKLQFAQDYQAREGVPIYNNNVLVAGALDRQRSTQEARPSHSTQLLDTVSSQRVPSGVDSSNDDDSGNDDSDEADDESSDKDLQQKSSSEKRIASPMQSANKQEFDKSPTAATKLKQNTSRYERRPNFSWASNRTRPAI